MIVVYQGKARDNTGRPLRGAQQALGECPTQHWCSTWNHHAADENIPWCVENEKKNNKWDENISRYMQNMYYNNWIKNDDKMIAKPPFLEIWMRNIIYPDG